MCAILGACKKAGPDSRLLGPVDAVDSRSAFAEACARRRLPGGPDDDLGVIGRSRLLFEFRHMNNSINVLY
ncbi:hypothetical protein ACOMHN_056933 [Nucella lapillus]